MKFFLDTNILLDFILQRELFFNDAVQILDFAVRESIELYTSSQSVITSFYLSEKELKAKNLKTVFAQLFDYIQIAAVNSDMIKASLNSDIKDFEDAVQVFCAHQIENLEGIITRNLKDFSNTGIRIFSPTEALDFIHKNLRN